MYAVLLEDDTHIAQYVRQLLETAGHTVDLFDNGQALIDSLKGDAPDLFLLDWWVPGRTGMQVLQHIREDLKLPTPVIFLTGRTEEKDIANALNAGADDYCTKPIHAEVLLARIAALLRRSYPPRSASTVREILGYRFEAGEQKVIFNGNSVSLTDKEFALALYFFENADSAISRNKILLNLWGEEGTASSRSLDVHVSAVRRKLQLASPTSVARLRPVYGYGYRLVTLAADKDEPL